VRLGLAGVAPERGGGEGGEQRLGCRQRRARDGDGLAHELGQRRRGRKRGRQRREPLDRRIGDPRLDPRVARLDVAGERELLAVSRKQQADRAGAQDRARLAVDRDPRMAVVDEHELDVALPARAEPPARRVDDLACADLINLGQQEAHCGHRSGGGPGVPSESWRRRSNNRRAR
jgi:hypothetical protein